MRSKQRFWKQLLALYVAKEEIEAADLLRASDALFSVERLIAGEHRSRVESDHLKVYALETGNHGSASLAELQKQMSSQRLASSAGLREERGRLKGQARERYLSSRMQREQIQKLLDKRLLDESIKEHRLSQMSADDLFLSKRRWIEQYSIGPDRI
jgi:hypothetical protein